MDEHRTRVVFRNPNIKVGFHIGKDSSLVKTFDSYIHHAEPLTAYQLYISNGRAWQPPKVDVEDIKQARALLNRHKKYTCVHGCLLYNLAGSVKGKEDPNFNRNLENTCHGLSTELDVAAGFNAGVVVHVGASKDKEKGMKVISKAIEHVLERDNKDTKALAKGLTLPLDEFKKSRKVILENAAGEGNKVGSTLDEFSQIISGVKEGVRDQVKVCIDTAHIFGAGQYDLGKPKEVKRFFKEFDSKIGLDKLEMFHLNDSRGDFGSKKDRHENLGLGNMFAQDRVEDKTGSSTLDGLEGLEIFLKFAEKHKIPLIGEPPAKTKDGEQGYGGILDYALINRLCNIEESHFEC